MAFDFDTGKYAFYVWGAYGITAVVVGWMIAASLMSAAKWKREAARLQAEKDAPKQASKTQP